MKYDSLGDRMKGYENAYRLYLPRRMPVIIRIDGRAFHTFTRGFNRPFDEVLMSAMQLTAKKLCEEISGCKLAYVQSDEISLLVTNNDSIETQPWFDNNLQKLVSLSAAIATIEFNKVFSDCEWTWYRKLLDVYTDNNDKTKQIPDNLIDISDHHQNAQNKATFDARAFILPEDEVCNYFIWRQQDAVRNSIQMVAQSMYSHNELQNKNQSDLQELIHAKGVNWNDYSIPCKRGTCVIRNEQLIDGIVRNKWMIDLEIPTFTKKREYIENCFHHSN